MIYISSGTLGLVVSDLHCVYNYVYLEIPSGCLLLLIVILIVCNNLAFKNLLRDMRKEV